MNSRRDFFKKATALGIGLFLFNKTAIADSQKNSIIKPKAINPGDTFGIIAPASGLFNAHQTIIEAKEKIQNLGFKVKIGKNIFKRKGYLAGSIKDRIEDLHNMFKDPEVKAIITIRGGYGSAQLLPYIDYNLIKKHPKIFVGYSDITSLLIGINKMTGLVTFHGPVAISTFTEYTKTYFLKTLESTTAIGEIEDAPYEDNLQTSNRVWTYKPGKAKGRLIGGNMTLLQASMGTPYEFDTDGAILFLEEVGEEPYDIDRILTQFKLAGKFDKCKGVVFGKISNIQPATYKPAFNTTLSTEEIIENIFKDFDFPVCTGLSLGHIKHKPTLPIGIQAELDADRGKLKLLEPAVI